ncbi:MAG: DUF1844 domain-containing protein [Myxococcales bacterium]|nr:DUF1844 domain-containing protein [Myxococcales bacterium]
MTDNGANIKQNSPCSDPSDPACTSFRTLVMSLASTAMLHLGQIPDPDTHLPAQNLGLALHTIALLAMLEQKTKGNLTAEENALIKGVLSELRTIYDNIRSEGRRETGA